MLTIALLASCSLLTVEPALSSKHDVIQGQERDTKRNSIKKSFEPYRSPTTHNNILARTGENRIIASPGNEFDGNMTCTLHIVHHTWSMFVPAAEAAQSQSQVYRQIYETALNKSNSLPPSARVALTLSAFGLTLAALTRMIHWNTVLAVLPRMVAGFLWWGT